jgi:adenylate kinase
MIGMEAADPSRDRSQIAPTVQGPRLVMMGRQGAGKGTQCARLAARLGITHIDVGDALRHEVRRHTALGEVAKPFLDEGRLLPDEMVTDVVLGQLEWVGCRGFVLDGFPRTLPQAEALGATVGMDGIDLVVNLAITPAVALHRLLSRRVCTRCQLVTTITPGSPSCPDCGGLLVRRTDDTAIAIKLRLANYEVQTRPVLGWYAIRGRLVTIDGRLDLDAVTWRILDAMTPMQRLDDGKLDNTARRVATLSAPGRFNPVRPRGMVGPRKSDHRHFGKGAPANGRQPPS